MLRSMGDEKPDIEELARRYLDLWQDQINALAADPATAGAMAKGLQTLSNGMAAFMGGLEVERRSDTDAAPAPAGTSSSAAPPDDARVEHAGLAGRIAALERRVDALERQLGAQRPRPQRRVRRDRA